MFILVFILDEIPLAFFKYKIKKFKFFSQKNQYVISM